MKEVFRRSKELDLRAFEQAPAERLSGELRPVVSAILVDTMSLLGAVLDECGPNAAESGEVGGGEALVSSYLPFERAVDVTMAAKSSSRRIVEEVAFIAQLELRQRQQRLERARVEHGAMPLLGEADSSLRRIRKALSAVESAIAGAEGVQPLLVFTSETELSLAVRRSYAKFRARLRIEEEPNEENLYARFRAAGTQIAMLVGWDVYPELRVRDRLLLRDLQQRILAWLRGGDASTASEGLRLWQDLAASVEMFSLVNRRQELVEHDTVAIHDALGRMRDGPGAVDDESWKLLESLEGLDPELDVLLATEPRLPAQAYVESLQRLSTSFVRPTRRPPGGGPAPW